jgi:GTPase SAR1 family protein
MHLVYDGSNRESFEAVPQWLEELENYVPPEVVKIIVENKLDKVMSSPLLSSHHNRLFRRPLTRYTYSLTHPTPI